MSRHRPTGKMTREEALAAAQRLWGAHGAWAEPAYVGLFNQAERWQCRVGWLVDAPGGGTHRVVLGRGWTWEAALQSADRRLARMAEQRPTPPRRRGPEGLPNVDMFSREDH